jgi:hypothetical protein
MAADASIQCFIGRGAAANGFILAVMSGLLSWVSKGMTRQDRGM